MVSFGVLLLADEPNLPRVGVMRRFLLSGIRKFLSCG